MPPNQWPPALSINDARAGIRGDEKNKYVKSRNVDFFGMAQSKSSGLAGIASLPALLLSLCRRYIFDS
jgi:hypothetical protein